MRRLAQQRGFSLLEMLVSLLVLSLAATALTTLMIQNSRLNKAQQMYVDVQINARSCMELVVSRLRSAGWDPMNAGIAMIGVDPDLTNNISQIEVYADHDEDGLTNSDGEQVIIRHRAAQIEWRVNNDPSTPYAVLAYDISNDANEDGIIEPMFQPDPPTDPERVVVQITARSPVPDLRTGHYIHYTLRSEVTLRKKL